MPLVVDRKQVLDVYSEVRERGWVLPSFNAENLATVEAILEAARAHGQTKELDSLPIIIGITSKYPPRPQAVFYTNTRKWIIGLRLFMKSLEVLTSPDSPYGNLRVMIHLDHIQWDSDSALLDWDMNQFSSIMYDASTLPLQENITHTAAFVDRHRNDIIIEGACDELPAAPGETGNRLTAPWEAETYFRETGVDVVVANLGTEHRAPTSSLKYEGQLAREISRRIGPRLCLHGGSSLADGELAHCFSDGICKVNVWTVLERGSATALFQKMVENAAKIVGPEKAREMLAEGLIGKNADVESPHSMAFYASSFRSEIVFRRMKDIVQNHLRVLCA
jgi:fructose-bisphosphate aldolase class II